jgi:hypothetical protein
MLAGKTVNTIPVKTIGNIPDKLKKFAGIIQSICKFIAVLAEAIKALQRLFF